jgi:hypothetical protein
VDQFRDGAIRGRSFQQSLIDDGNLEAARFWGQVKVASNAGVGALYKRGAIRMCKHPFDFRSDNAEYHNGSGGEWRILRDGRLCKTDPKKVAKCGLKGSQAWRGHSSLARAEDPL